MGEGQPWHYCLASNLPSGCMFPSCSSLERRPWFGAQRGPCGLREGQHVTVLLCVEGPPAAWRYCLPASAWPGQLPAQLQSPHFLTMMSAPPAHFHFRQVNPTTFLCRCSERQCRLVVVSTGSGVGYSCVPAQVVSSLSLPVKWVQQ